MQKKIIFLWISIFFSLKMKKEIKQASKKEKEQNKEWKEEN